MGGDVRTGVDCVDDGEAIFADVAVCEGDVVRHAVSGELIAGAERGHDAQGQICRSHQRGEEDALPGLIGSRLVEFIRIQVTRRPDCPRYRMRKRPRSSA